MYDLWNWDEYIKTNYGSYTIIAFKKDNNFMIVAKTINGGQYDLATIYNEKVKILKPKSARVRILLSTRKVNNFIVKISKLALVNDIILK